MRCGIALVSAAAALLLFAACSEKRPERPRRVRPSALAGSWYPARKADLEREVTTCLDGAEKVSLEGRLVALIAPHAGYRYSGEVAGWAFRQALDEKFDRVIVMAPSHHGAFRGFSIMEVDAYATPLGEIALDRHACDTLAAHKLHVKADQLHAVEHAIEIELPFLQQVLRGNKFQLIPILVGSLAAGDAEKIGAALNKHLSPTTLVVVSSDFTHYGPNYGYAPFTTDIEANIKKLDLGAVDRIIAKDFNGYVAYLEKHKPTICGRNAIAVLLNMLPAEAQGRLLKYDTSGRMTGSFANSVSYVSAAFFLPDAVASEAPLGRAEQETLLRLARETVESAVGSGRLPERVEERYDITPRLKARSAVFVTLKKQGRLRGCIGRIGYPELAAELPPLYKTTMLMAVESSQRDRRFMPVRADELKDIEIEISVLTIAKEVVGPDAFIVGRHGIIIRKGESGAVFLPQVASEQGWDRTETLQHLCRKAGLPADAWRGAGMKFFTFTAQVFSEELLSDREQDADP